MSSPSKVRHQIKHQRARGRKVNIPAEDIASNFILRDAPVAKVFDRPVIRSDRAIQMFERG